MLEQTTLYVDLRQLESVTVAAEAVSGMEQLLGFLDEQMPVSSARFPRGC